MSGRGQTPPKLGEWLVALRDGTISEHDFGQLCELLESDTEARQYYVEYMQLAAILRKRSAKVATFAGIAPRFGFLGQAIAVGQTIAMEPTRRVLARSATLPFEGVQSVADPTGLEGAGQLGHHVLVARNGRPPCKSRHI